MPIGVSKTVIFGKGGAEAGTQTFNTSGTFTVPSGVSIVSITGVGGTGTSGNSGGTGNSGTGGGGQGGGGGNAGNAGNPGNAGSAASPSTVNCLTVTPGGSYPIVVGGPSGGQVKISWNAQ